MRPIPAKFILVSQPPRHSLPGRPWRLVVACRIPPTAEGGPVRAVIAARCNSPEITTLWNLLQTLLETLDEDWAGQHAIAVRFLSVKTRKTIQMVDILSCYSRSDCY